MKLTSMRTLAALSLCLLASALVAGKKNNVHWEDQVDARVLVVSNTNPSGPGSLQRAVDKANKCPETPTEITFCLSKKDPNYNPETETWLICIDKPLEITAPDVTIDGQTQKGSIANTESLENPNNAVLKVEIAPCAQSEAELSKSKALVTSQATAFLPIDTIIATPNAHRLTLRGLIVHGSSRPGTAAIRLQSNESLVEGSFVGTNAAGTLPDATVTALVIEGNNNNIGRSIASGRMLIGGRGYTTLPAAQVSSQAIPLEDGAIAFSGRFNALRNATVNLTRDANSALNAQAVLGIHARIAYSPAQASADVIADDLIIDKVAAAGYQDRIFHIGSFDRVTITNTSAGTNAKRTVAIPSGIGLNLSNRFSLDSSAATEAALPVDRGDFIARNFLASGNRIGLQLGVTSTARIKSVVLQDLLVGTNGTATAALGNSSFGAVSTNIADLDVSTSYISGNPRIGWQHRSDTLQSATATTAAVPTTVRFRKNLFGLSFTSPVSDTQDAEALIALPNGTSLHFLGSPTAQLDDNNIQFSTNGVVASKTTILTQVTRNILKNNTQFDLVYGNRIIRA